MKAVLNISGTTVPSLMTYGVIRRTMHLIMPDYATIQGTGSVIGADIIQAAEADLFEQRPVVLVPIFYVDDDPANFGKREEIFQAGPYQQEHIILHSQRGYYQLQSIIAGTCGIAQT